MPKLVLHKEDVKTKVLHWEGKPNFDGGYDHKEGRIKHEDGISSICPLRGFLGICLHPNGKKKPCKYENCPLPDKEE